MCDEVVAIDNSSSVCSVGFSGQKAPSAVFPSVVACHQGETYVGYRATNKRLRDLCIIIVRLYDLIK